MYPAPIILNPCSNFLSVAVSPKLGCGFRATHRSLSSSFLGLRYRILNINHKKNYFLGAYGYGLEDLEVPI